MSRRTRVLDLLFVAGTVFAHACSQPGATGAPQVRLVAPTENSGAYVEVSGLSNSQQRMLPRAAMTSEQWQEILVVSVKSSDGANSSVPVAGRYALERNVLRFTPLYPFDPGRSYEVRFGSNITTVGLPARPPVEPAFVTTVYPSGDLVPENQLRMYIHFSAPMGRRGGVDHVKLLDDRGREVDMPFLPLEAEFWNTDRTRYTVFFDPGRQKRGILPNREMGPSLVEGRRYTLVIDRSWTDGNGRPLRESFTKRFRVGPPVLSALEPARWRLEIPKSGTREPLSVNFPAPLDRALLLNAIGVRRNGQPLAGEVRVDRRETHWSITPTEPWQAGPYELSVLSILEDLAGNRIGRPFEVGEFSQPSASPSDSIAVALPFTIRP